MKFLFFSPQQKKALNLEIKKEDDETINKAVAAMSGRRYTKRTKAQIIKDRAPRVYKDIREQD